jgi:hypothetical protein
MASYSNDNVSLAINRLPLPKLKTQVIPLFITSTLNGTFQINRTEMQNIPQIYDIWLKDAFKKDSLDLRNNATYSFNITPDTNSYGSKRFSIVIRENQGLAFHLLNFTGVKSGNTNVLTWVTQDEFDYTNFAVQRSTNGGATFITIDSLTSNSSGTYTFTDINPALPMDQYRIKSIDINGAITYSNLVTIMYANTNNVAASSIDIYPNPSADIIHLTIIPLANASSSGSVNAAVSYDVKVINTLGTVIQSSTTNQTNWQTDISGLKPGAYFVRVINTADNSVVGVKKFIKL